MYNEQPPRQRMPEKDMRRNGPPPDMERRRGGPPPEKMGDDQKQPREFRPRDGEHRGGRGGYNDDRGEPREYKRRGEFNGDRGARGGNREPRPFNPTEKQEGLDRSRFG